MTLPVDDADAINTLLAFLLDPVDDDGRPAVARADAQAAAERLATLAATVRPDGVTTQYVRDAWPHARNLRLPRSPAGPKGMRWLVYIDGKPLAPNCPLTLPDALKAMADQADAAADDGDTWTIELRVWTPEAIRQR